MPMTFARMLIFVLCTSAAAVAHETQPSADVAPATQPAAPVAPNRVTAVTVYQGTALVTREVQIKEGNGLMELIVSPLPERRSPFSPRMCTGWGR